MKHENGKISGLKLAYIGGGSRGWAWTLMSDLMQADDIEGTVHLYDIDKQAALDNQIIGRMYNDVEGAKSHWDYEVFDTLEGALKDVDFVIISILPATLNEMQSDVHTPEKYGIYQSVGDTTGAGGIIRSLRAAPMFEVIAKAIKENCPNAWVINYTNPMTLCVKTLYRVFPQIKAFGCCHEVFGTMKFFVRMLKEFYGVKEEIRREDIKVNVVGINHFTWLTSAQYKNIDLFDVYKKFCIEHPEGTPPMCEDNWMNAGTNSNLIKMDLFKRYGYVAAAGDRHLAEFCPAEWYLNDEKTIKSWQYKLTSVEWRKKAIEAHRKEESRKFISGEKPLELRLSGEDGVNQIRAILGLHEMITNVNIPNVGQIPNLPLGAIVETNAIFRSNEVRPVFAGNIPAPIYSMVARIVGEQEALDAAIRERDLEKAFNVFVTDPQLKLPLDKARELFDEMVKNTKGYLGEYL